MSVDAVLEAVRVFVTRHLRCGEVLFDTPHVPDGRSHGIVLACRCGETLERWLDDAAVSRLAFRVQLSRGLRRFSGRQPA